MTSPPAVWPIVDTHVHLDEPAFDTDLPEVLASARAAGVLRFVDIAYKPERWQSARALREAHPGIAIVVGVHPQEASGFDQKVERALRRAITDLAPVAVGETGFDFNRSLPAPRDQERAFRAQLSIAAEFGLPVVIHQRAASDALIAELDRWPDLAPIVLHSFDGDERLTLWAIERNHYVGIGGLACKPSSESLRGLLARMPPDRLLLETDAPYLAPPGAESRRNAPANLPLIARLLAPLWGLTAENLCRMTTRNADAVFGLGLGHLV